MNAHLLLFFFPPLSYVQGHVWSLSRQFPMCPCWQNLGSCVEMLGVLERWPSWGQFNETWGETSGGCREGVYFLSKKWEQRAGSLKLLEGCDSHLVTMGSLKLKSNTTKRVTQWAETSIDLSWQTEQLPPPWYIPQLLGSWLVSLLFWYV